MDSEKIVEELGYDVITVNPYDAFALIGANTSTKTPKTVFASEKKDDRYDKYLNELCGWLADYGKLNKIDRLSLSDVVVTNATSHCVHGVIHVCNGLNGVTKVSRQSLKHVMDIIEHLEDFYGARAWISSVSMHSDVFYYTISFVIWGDRIENLDKYWGEKYSYDENWFGNLKPLSHWR